MYLLEMCISIVIVVAVFCVCTIVLHCVKMLNNAEKCNCEHIEQSDQPIVQDASFTEIIK